MQPDSPDAGPEGHATLAPAPPATPLGPAHGETLASRPAAADTPPLVASLVRLMDPPQAAGELGRVLHYRALCVLGTGGMGVVFEAEDANLGRRVALKLMRPDAAADPSARQRFLREARATAAVRSDHIVTIFDVGLSNNVPYLAMERLDGRTVDEWARGRPPLTAAQVLDVALQVARGLADAHAAGLIHRDIKPANLWIEPESGRVKILDLGLARANTEQSRITSDGMIVGTPAYMAPEQADGKPPDARADLFSLGCVMYELAAGRPPFGGETVISVLKAVALDEPPDLRTLNAGLPPALVALVGRLLAKSPARRPASANEVVAELRQIAASSGSMTAALDTGATLGRGPGGGSRLRGVAVAGGILLLAGLAVGGFLLAARRGPTIDAGDAPAAGRPTLRATDRGVTESEILLGLSAPFGGPARELGRQIQLGVETRLRAVNAAGGVHGRKLRLLPLDDGYEPARALANAHTLVEEKRVFALVGSVGTPTAEAVLPYAREQRLPLVGLFTGAASLRKTPPDRYVFNLRAGYAEEAAAAVAHLTRVRRIKPSEIAVFAQQDAYGDSGFRAVARQLRDQGIDPETIVRVGHERNSLDVAAAADAIAKRPDIKAVVMVTLYRQAARFIRRVREARPGVLFANVSFVNADALAEELREAGPGLAEGVIVTQVVPPADSHATAVRRFREDLAAHSPNEHAGSVSLEGYLAAGLLVEGLRRAGPDVTVERFVDALETVRDLDLGLGKPVNLGPSEHQASHAVWATVFDAQGKTRELDLEP